MPDKSPRLGHCDDYSPISRIIPIVVSNCEAKLSKKGGKGDRLKVKKTANVSLCSLTLYFSLLLSPSGWQGMMMMMRRRPARGGAGHARRG